MSRQIFLMEEDYEASEELARHHRENHGIETARPSLGDIARIHAIEGRRRFLLIQGAAPPRHRFEEHELARATGSITDQEYKHRMLDDENSPICQETLSAYFEDQFENINWYGRLLQSLSMVPNAEGKFPKAGFVERCLRELNRSLSLPARQLEILVEFLEEQRVFRGLGRIVIKDATYSCSFDLLASTRNFAREAWEKSLEIAEQSVGKQRISIMATQLFSQEFLPHLPLPGDLESNLQEEYALGRLALKASESVLTPVAATVSATNEVHSKAKAATDGDQSDGNGTPNSIAEKATTSRSATSSKHKPKLKNWAIATEDGKKWCLFHQRSGVWEQRRKLKIPQGYPSALLQKLAEDDGDLSVKETTEVLRRNGHTGTPDKLRRAVTDAFKAIRKEVILAIADCSGGLREDVSDPFLSDTSGYSCVINIGYAIKTSDGGMTFGTAHQLKTALQDKDFKV